MINTILNVLTIIIAIVFILFLAESFLTMLIAIIHERKK